MACLFDSPVRYGRRARFGCPARFGGPGLGHHEGVSWPSRVFLSGQAVSLLGDGLAVLAIPLLVLDLTRSPLISALSAASVTLGYLAVGLPADGVTFGMSLVTLVAVRGGGPPLSRRAGGGWRALTADFRAGLAYLLSVRVLVIMTVVQVIVNLCLATEKLMFFYARDTLGLGAAGVGAVVAAGGAGGIAGALSTTWLAARGRQMRLVVLAVAASGLAIGAVSATGSLVTLAAANLAYLWAITAASLANRTYRQLILPRDLLGRVTSTVRLLVLTA